MKLLQICNKAPYPANDGSSIAIYHMAKGLIENKVDLHLLTINTKKHFKDDSLVPEMFKARCHYRSVYKNTDTSLIGAFMNLLSNKSYFVSRFYFKEFQEALIEKLQEERFDIVQLEGLFMGSYIKLIKKYSKAKIILRAHNVEFLIWERHIANEKNIFKKWYLQIQTKRLKTFELKTIQEVDASVSITDADKNYLKTLVPAKKIANSFTGVDLNDYQLNPAITHQEKTLFYFGSMDWMPNQEAVEWFLNECWEQILKQIPDCKFVIAGRNMPEKFKNLSLPNVIIAENVDNKTDFYSAYQLMIVPLLSGSGLRIKIIEALSYGKAIVSTTIGAEGIPVTNNHNIIIADTAKDFSKAVLSLLENTHKQTELEKNAKIFASELLNNTTITAKLVSYYNNLIKD